MALENFIHARLDWRMAAGKLGAGGDQGFSGWGRLRHCLFLRVVAECAAH